MLTKSARAKLRQVKLIQIGGPVKHAAATLGVYSPKIDIARITTLVGCKPTHAHEKGQYPKPDSRVPYRVGAWSLEAPVGLRFRQKIQYLLDTTTQDIHTWHGLAKNHDIVLDCALFLQSLSEGIELSAAMLTDIGARRWTLALTVYGADTDEILSAFFRKPRSKKVAKGGGPTTP